MQPIKPLEMILELNKHGVVISPRRSEASEFRFSSSVIDQNGLVRPRTILVPVNGNVEVEYRPSMLDLLKNFFNPPKIYLMHEGQQLVFKIDYGEKGLYIIYPHTTGFAVDAKYEKITKEQLFGNPGVNDQT